MKIRVRSRGDHGSESESRAHAQVATALARNEQHIRKVRVDLEHQAAECAAFCRLEVEGERAWRVIVEEVDDRLDRALERASRRAAFAVGDRLETCGCGRGTLRAWPSRRNC